MKSRLDENRFARDLLARVTHGPCREPDLLDEALRRLAEHPSVTTAAVVAMEEGHWHATVLAGTPATLPYAALSEALDAESPQTYESPQAHESWWLGPLGTDNELLAIRYDGDLSEVHETLRSIAEQLGACLAHIRSVDRHDRMTKRLATILDVAATWRKTLDIDELLEEMARASTRLLDCERATIFLWDRTRRQLIGRPALGVEGNELRIPDDTGVVGRVVHRDTIERVDPTENDAIDRRVDRKLGFRTRSILCVPLHDRRGRVMGAFEAINKTDEGGKFDREDEETLTELARHAALALDQTQAYRTLKKNRDRLVADVAESVRLVGSSPGIEQLRATIERAAPTTLTVLILGENGTGKEVVARMIHFQSDRKTEPFVAVNCAALAPSLLDSELFGHERGAFTDAHETRPGKFEQASSGTLFLDEIGDLSLEAQAKLLRVLEQRVVTRVGGSEEIPVDVRLIAATNRDLEQAVSEGTFRQDLFYRLDGLTLMLPPLRERGSDVVELAEFFLEQFGRDTGRAQLTLSKEARQRLMEHSWPGNVRELRNMMERLACMVAHEEIGASDLLFRPGTTDPQDDRMREGGTLAEATRDFQSRYIEQQIEQAGGSITEAARRLGMHRSNLYRKMKQLGMTEILDES